MHGWFCFGKESTSSRRVILKFELELNNLNSILSRSAVTPVFPLHLAQVRHAVAEPLINNSVYPKNHQEGETKNNKLFRRRGAGNRKNKEKGRSRHPGRWKTGKMSVFRAWREHAYEKQVEAGFWSRRRRHWGDPNTCITWFRRHVLARGGNEI